MPSQGAGCRATSLLGRFAQRRERGAAALERLLPLALLGEPLALAFDRFSGRFVAEVRRELTLQAGHLTVAVSQLLHHAIQFGLDVEQALGRPEPFNSTRDPRDRPCPAIRPRPL